MDRELNLPSQRHRNIAPGPADADKELDCRRYSHPTHRGRGTGAILNAHDRDLLMLLDTVGKWISGVVTGLFEDSLTCDEQTLFANQLVEVAEGFRHRVHRTPLVIEGDIAP